jgi:hypothetical protein
VTIQAEAIDGSLAVVGCKRPQIPKYLRNYTLRRVKSQAGAAPMGGDRDQRSTRGANGWETFGQLGSGDRSLTSRYPTGQLCPVQGMMRLSTCETSRPSLVRAGASPHGLMRSRRVVLQALRRKNRYSGARRALVYASVRLMRRGAGERGPARRLCARLPPPARRALAALRPAAVRGRSEDSGLD